MSAQEILKQEFATLAELVAAHARARPDAVAVVDGERRMTWRELEALADRVAAGLQRDGVGPGAAGAICATSSADYLAVFLGALRVGAAVSPLAPSATAAQLQMMLADCAAPLLFLDAAVGEALAPIRSRMTARWIALDEEAPGTAFTDWLPPASARPHEVAIGPDAPFNIIYSSGTTGAPKGIVHSHAFRWSPLAAGAMFGFRPQAVTLASTPLYSNTTLGSVFWSLAHGGTLVLMRKFDAEEFLRLAEAHRVTHAMLVPVQYRRLMASPAFDSFDLSAFEMKFSTSAPFAAALKADVLRRWPGGLVEFFAMTEGGGTLMLLAHEHPDKLHTVGRPAPGHDIRVIGEDGVELPAGEVGEVVGRSAAMMSGYHNQPQNSAGAEWFGLDGARFIRTGDVGRFDADGFFVPLDRKKDVIISGGFNVYPSDLEAVIVEHAAVLEAAVVGVPSDAWGETPVAFVVPVAEKAVSAAELAAFVAARVGRTQRPQAYQIIESLPRSAIGKVLKRELRDGFRGQVA